MSSELHLRIRARVRAERDAAWAAAFERHPFLAALGPSGVDGEPLEVRWARRMELLLLERNHYRQALEKVAHLERRKEQLEIIESALAGPPE